MLMPRMPFVGSEPVKNLNITKNKVVYGLIITLALFSFLKVNSTARMERKLIRSSASVLLAQIPNINDTAAFNQYFTTGNFCGWTITRQGMEPLSSPDFNNTANGKEVIDREFEIGGVKQTFTLCIDAFDGISASVTRQFFFILLLTGAIIFLMNLKTQDELKNEKKIPNA